MGLCADGSLRRWVVQRMCICKCTEVYLTRFKWDEAKFPSRRPLKETVEKIIEIMARIEDDLKVWAEYSAEERSGSGVNATIAGHSGPTMLSKQSKQH